MVAECKSPMSSAITNLPSRGNTIQTCCTLWRVIIALEPIVVGCSLTFSCTPKDVKVHDDDNGAAVLLTNLTSFIGIIKHLNDTRSTYNSVSVLVLSIKHLNNVVNILIITNAHV